MQTLFAVVGMAGSGKTEAAEYLAKAYAYPKVHFGEITHDEVRRRGLAETQENERIVREDLREKFGKDHYAKKVTEKIDALGDVPVVFLESLYSWTEYLVFKEKYGDKFFMIAIHASPKVRYGRLAVRPVRPLSAEEAWMRDKTELEKVDKGGPIAMADHVIVNEGAVEEMHQSLDEIMASLGIDRYRA